MMVPDRAVAVMLHGQELLLVKRLQRHREYWTLPGGGVEPGETVEQALLREILEETGLVIDAAQFLFNLTNRGRIERYFLCTSPTKAVLLAGEELTRQSINNRDTLTWVPVNAIAELDL